jgi:endonuclease/exonuclease/phosphatase (EEP) superfamily protein YafD
MRRRISPCTLPLNPKTMTTEKSVQSATDRILIIGLLTAPFTVLAFLGRWHALLELCSHFRLQYLGVSLILSGLAFWRRKTGIAGLMATLALVNAAVVFLPAAGNGTGIVASTARETAGPERRFLLFNLNANNGKLPAVQSFIRANDPDIVVLLELTPEISNSLALKDMGYQFVLERPQDDNFGIGIYSKYNFTESDVVMFGRNTMPSLAVTVDFDGTLTRVIGGHPLPPMGPRHTASRDRYLQAMAAWVARDARLPVVVMMDMNTTPWSPAFTDFMDVSGLRDSRKGFGLQTTWPDWMPLLRIPIDHIFVSHHIDVRERMVGPSLGSDHRPVLMSAAVRPGQ